MPIVQVNMLEGRTVEQKRKLVAGITNAVCEAVGAKPESVRVLIHELGGEDFAIAGKTANERGQTIAK